MKDDVSLVVAMAIAFAVFGVLAFSIYMLITEGIPWLIEFLKVNGVRFP